MLLWSRRSLASRSGYPVVEDLGMGWVELIELKISTLDFESEPPVTAARLRRNRPPITYSSISILGKMPFPLGNKSLILIRQMLPTYFLGAPFEPAHSAW